jgi:hypothetical protein
MQSFRNMAKARSLLIGAGAYYLAAWITPLLAVGFDKLTNGIIYTGDFESAVVMPMVVHLPEALVAAAVGAVVVWLVESDTHIRRCG